MFKKLAAGLIATSLFLPLSSCHTYLGPKQEEIHHVDGRGIPSEPKTVGNEEGLVPIEVYAKTHDLPAGVSLQKQYKFFLAGGSPRDPFIWLGLLAMLWPLGWVMATRWLSTGRFCLWMDLLSPLLLVGTGWMLIAKTAMGDHLEVGFWTTSAGIWIYAAHGAWCVSGRLEQRFPALRPWMKHWLMALVFSLGAALPCSMIKGHFFP